jgi:hypothetical protein
VTCGRLLAVTVQNSPASAADLLAMLLEAGCYAKFVGEEVLAKPMGVTAAGTFLGRGMCLRPSGV